MCPGVSALEKACSRAEGESLDQMLGNGRPAGFIISADVKGNVVRVRAQVHEAAALLKVTVDPPVYSGLVLEFDEDDRFHRVSLYDTDQLEKGGKQDVCVIFDRDEAHDRLFSIAAVANSFKPPTEPTKAITMDALMESLGPPLVLNLEKGKDLLS